MTTRLKGLTRPVEGSNHESPTTHRRIGFTLAVVGLALGAISLIANLVAADLVGDGEASLADQTLAWSFGLNTAGFGTIKLGIAIVLVGILVRLWQRVESVKRSLPELKAKADPKIEIGAISTPFGPASSGKEIPGPLAIHTMAKRMWAPMLAMGYMAVIAGLITSLLWAGDPANVALASWTQGLQFLGEGLLLAGISFLLGTILASLREGGGEVQAALGLTVKTLDMPKTAKLFVGLMALGVMVSMLQFVLYLVVANGVDNAAAWFAWLGPLREVGLGL
ncbi:MAG: hypothetical protein WEE53_13265, partial [Acidimicrobiia bacterium]